MSFLTKQETIHNVLFAEEVGHADVNVDDEHFNEAEGPTTGDWQPSRNKVKNPKADQGQAFTLFSQIASKHFAGKSLQKDLWNRFYREVSDNAKRFESNRKQQEKDYPTVSMDIILKQRSNGKIKMFTARNFPRKKFRRNDFQVMSIYYHCDVSEIAKFHASLHESEKRLDIFDQMKRRNLKFNLGIDGVPHSKSGAKKMTLLSVQFEECQLIYNTGVYIRANNYNVSAGTLLQRFVNEAKKIDFPLKLKYIIMDLVMKCYVLNVKQFNGSYGNKCLRQC